MRSRDVAQQQRRHASRSAAPFVALVVGVAAVVVLIRRGYIPYNQRAFNKRWLNPLMLRAAGSPFFPHAVILHQGRASGRYYTTPVYVEPIINGFAIPLPYGTQVDWLRNVLAVGQATIRWHGQVYSADEPMVLDVATTLPGLSPFRRWAFRAIGTRQMLVVRLAPSITMVSAAG